MHGLHIFLRDRNIDGIRQAALVVGASIFSAISVVVLQLGKPRGAWQIVISVFLATATLAVIVRLIQRLFLLAWASPILGLWVYESSSGNWGLANIGLRGGDLTYTVQLYRTAQDASAAADNEPGFAAKCFATVSSVGVTYENGTVELIYKITQTQDEYAPRSGMLSLSPLSPTAMKGYWKSDIAGAEPSRGVLNMYRHGVMRPTDDS
jgi:hypothetical protein